MIASRLYYNGATSLSHFLHDLEYEYYSLLSSSAWIEAVYCHLTGEALEWAKNDEDVTRIHYNAYHGVAIDRDANQFLQLLNDRFATSLGSRFYKALKGVKQEHHEFIEDYYVRFKTIFEHVGGQDGVAGQHLDDEQDYCLFEVIEWFVGDLRNTKLRVTMSGELWDMCAEDRRIISLQSTCIAAQLKRTMMKRTRKPRKSRNQSSSTSQADTSVLIDMSQSILEQIPCDLPEISTSIYSSSHTSESVKWTTAPTSLQQPSPDISIVNESQPILEELPCNLSETNADIMNTSDTESVDEEILVSGPRNWTTAPAEKEVFALATTYSASSKSPPAVRVKDIELPIPVDMPSPEHLTTENAPVTEAFDPDTAIGALSKSPSIQHTEDPETTEKTSVSAFIDSASDTACTYELPELPTFDLSIDIDFSAYIIDTEIVNSPPASPSRRKMQLSPFRGLALRHNSFGWSHSSCISSIDRRTSSISTCTSRRTSLISTCTTSIPDTSFIETPDTEFYEEEQSSCSSSCSIDDTKFTNTCTTTPDTDFYWGEQSVCSSIHVITTDSVVHIDALILIAGLNKVKTSKNPAWMSLLGPIPLLAWLLVEYLTSIPKYKGLPKVKIKS